MTGPEHYRAAEQMIEAAQDPAESGDRAFLMTEAQTHALLALAAATANPFTPQAGWDQVTR